MKKVILWDTVARLAIMVEDAEAEEIATFGRECVEAGRNPMTPGDRELVKITVEDV